MPDGPAPQLQSSVLDSLVSAVRYNDWLAALVAPYLGDHPLEVGSGLGEQAARWLDAGVPELTVSELDDTFVAELQQRFADDSRVRVVRLDLSDPPPARHSAVVAMNVLEHIEDDVAALSATRALLEPDGRVVVFVPAFEFAMSRFDRAIGHFRRYTKASLADAYERAGLGVDVLHYVNAPGLLAWVVVMKWLRSTPKEGLALRLWDRLVIPVTRAAERRIKPPFGQSVLGVGRFR